MPACSLPSGSLGQYHQPLPRRMPTESLPRSIAVIPSVTKLPVESAQTALGFASRPCGRFAFVEDERLRFLPEHCRLDETSCIRQMSAPLWSNLCYNSFLSISSV